MKNKCLFFAVLAICCVLPCSSSFSVTSLSPAGYQLSTSVIAGTGTSEPSSGGYQLLDVGAQPVSRTVKSSGSLTLESGGLYHLIAMYQKVPQVQVTFPTASGEIFTINTPYTIQWTASDDYGISSIEVFYTTDNGMTWLPILPVLPGSAVSTSWTTPNTVHTQVYIKVKANSVSGFSGYDLSDYPFRIASIGALYYVNPYTTGANPGNDSNSGTSIADPFLTIRHALDLMATDGRIVLLDGLYNQGVINNWPNASNITMFANNTSTWDAVVITVPSGRVFDFSGLNVGIPGTIEGITITEGVTTESGGGAYGGTALKMINFNFCLFRDNSAKSGGGIYNLKASNSTFINNTASQNGGGASSSEVVNCNFTGNHAAAGNGGAMYAGTAVDSDFFGNNASNGGAIYNTYARECSIGGNTAAKGGGAYYSLTGTMENCMVNENYNGSGVYVDSTTPGTALNIINCTLYKNTPYNTNTNNGTIRFFNSISWTGAIYINPSGYTFLDHSDYQTITGAPSLMSGNISSTPEFEDVSAYNFYLQPTSPCRDTGAASYAGLLAPSIDIQGIPRPSGLGYDMGCYEFYDYHPPVISMSNPPAWIGQAGYTLSWGVTDPLSDLVTPNPLAIDVLYGPGGVWDTGVYPASGSNLFSMALLPQTHEAYFRLTAQDLAGFVTTKESTHFGVDTISPTATIEINSGNPIAYSKNVNFTITPTDDTGSGVDHITVKPGSAAPVTTYHAPWPSLFTVMPPVNGLNNITFEVFDLAGNSTVETRSITLSLPITPEIENIRINGKPIAYIKYMPDTVKINYDIFDYTGTGLASVSLKIRTPVQDYAISTIYSQDATDITFNLATSEGTMPIPKGHFNIIIEALGVNGQLGTWESSSMSITNISSVTTKPKSIPNPFSPRVKKQTVRINYSLSTNSDIDFIIYDVTGKAIWRRFFAAGTEGGQVNENNILWDGMTDNHVYAANGVYIYVIVSDGKVLTKSQLSVIN